jgi:hypothetical protein
VEASAQDAYRPRTEVRAGGPATFEAIARALEILEGDAGAAIEEELLRVFRVMVERTIWLRGVTPDCDITRALTEPIADDPRGTGPNVACTAEGGPYSNGALARCSASALGRLGDAGHRASH